MALKENIKSLAHESWQLCWPMTLIMFYEFLVGMADVYVAGKIGRDVQAAYGLAFQIYFIFIIVGIAFSIGIVSVISRLFTDTEKRKEFGDAISTSLVITIAAGILFTVAGVFLAGWIINLCNVPSELKPYAAPLLRIYSLAFLFDYVLLSSNGILRSTGHIKKSLISMTVTCLLNIVLNFVLVFYTPLGVAGIGWATVISLGTGALINLLFMKKLFTVSLAFSRDVLKKIMEISWPSGLLQAIWQLGAMMLFLIIAQLPRYNVETLAAFTNGLKIESAIFLPAFAFNMANSVVVGNLLGKRDNNNAFLGGIITAIGGVIVVSCLTVIIMFNAKSIAGMLSENQIVIRESIKYIYIALICEPILAWGIVLGGGLNGAGDTKSVMVITTIGVWCIRIPLSYLLGIKIGLGAIAIWWSMNLSVFFQSVMLTYRFYGKKWMKAVI